MSGGNGVGLPLIPLFKVRMATEARLRVAEVLESGYLGEGPVSRQFEEALQSRVSTGQNVVVVNSGTSALELAYELLGLERGDEVISTPMTCVATNVGLARRGCRIRWADCDPDTGMIDVASAHELVTDRTRAIVCVDWTGVLSPVEQLRSAGVPVVQDAAHSLSPLIGPETRPADFTAWSFQAIKHLTSVDGGALLVENNALALARRLRWYGLDRSRGPLHREPQDLERAGFKWHLSDVNAAVGLANLPGLGAAVDRSRAIAAHFRDVLGSALPASATGWSSSWMCAVTVDDPLALRAHLASLGIESGQVHQRNDQLTALGAFTRPLPGVDVYAARYLAIPCGWWMSDSDVEKVADAVRAYQRTKA